MSKFISSANASIKVVDDASYIVNDALHINAVFSASAIVKANTDVLFINLPDCGAHAEVGWFNTGIDHATADASVKKTTSSVDGLNAISIQLGTATEANHEYNVEGWVKLK
jgi:hypothetical protein